MKVSSAKWIRFRIHIVFAFFVLIWACLILRAFHLQVLDQDNLAGQAASQYQRIIKINPVRGDIFDRQGEKLAVSLDTDSIFANPQEIQDSVRTAAQLAKILDLDRGALVDKLKSKTPFVWIKRQVSPEESAQVAELNLSGLGSIKESKRFYPNKQLAAHLLGFTGVDTQGLGGLENYYDEYLQGTPSSWRVMCDALGRTFLDRDAEAPPGLRGSSLTLTLDRRIQFVTEKALAAAVEQYKARGGSAVVVRPKTGEILAAAVVPSFNPNVYQAYRSEQRRNRVLTDAFDPGSTFKIFVTAGALAEGLVKPLDLINCENGAYTVDRHIIHDHTKHGWLTVNKVIKYSSNIGALKIGEELGPARLYHYLSRFGFGEKSGIDLPGESAGLMRPYQDWRKLDSANVAFGQGISVTALQMVMAMAALANDGFLMRPYIVAEITDCFGRTIKKNRPLAVRQVVSAETAQKAKAMLRMVVEEGGTGTRAEPVGYPAAGKTGTAQKLDRVSGTYSDRNFFSSFVGFVPWQEPELAIFVGLDEPHPEIYGGIVAAPVFREIAEQVLPLLNVQPLVPLPEEIQSVETEKIPRAAAWVNSDRAAQAPDSDSSADGADLVPQVIVSEEKGRETMPNLAGLSMGRVLELMSAYGVSLIFSGSGRAVWQNPPPGGLIKAGQICRVKFEQG